MVAGTAASCGGVSPTCMYLNIKISAQLNKLASDQNEVKAVDGLCPSRMSPV